MKKLPEQERGLMVARLITKLLLLNLLLTLSSCEFPIFSHEKVSEYNQRNSLKLDGLKYIDGLGLWVGMDWVSGPFGSPVNESIFELNLYDDQGVLTPLPDNINIVHYGWMPYMGHGSADDGILLKVYPGQYKSQDFYFNMPGLWDMHFRFKQNGHLIHEIVFRFIF